MRKNTLMWKLLASTLNFETFHFAWLCWGFEIYEVKKGILQKENGNTLTFLIIINVKNLQKEQIAQITQYDPWSAGISVQWPLSNLTLQVTNSTMYHNIKSRNSYFYSKKYRKVASRSTCYYSENQVFGGATNRDMSLNETCYYS